MTAKELPLSLAENVEYLRRLRELNGITGFADFHRQPRPAPESPLIEIEGFVPASDPRLERLREQFGAALYRLLGFGGYAVPLSAAELSDPAVPGFATAASIAAAAKG